MMQMPESAAAAYVSEDDTVSYVLDPFLLDMRWEGIRVDSATFKALPPAERLYELSQAFLYSANVLCERVGDTTAELGWPQAAVCKYCLHLATELFLKACILQVGHEPTKHHEIPELRSEYTLLLPDEKYYFKTPWWISAKDLRKAFGFEVLHGVDRKPDELFRYSMDKKGVPSAGVQMFAPGYQFNYMKGLQTRWKEIWADVRARNDG
jgi:hypothetical protein